MGFFKKIGKMGRKLGKKYTKGKSFFGKVSKGLDQILDMGEKYGVPIASVIAPQYAPALVGGIQALRQGHKIVKNVGSAVDTVGGELASGLEKHHRKGKDAFKAGDMQGVADTIGGVMGLGRNAHAQASSLHKELQEHLHKYGFRNQKHI